MPPPATSNIGPKAAQTLYYAIGELSETIGRPLNVWVTINFTDAGIELHAAGPAFARLRYNYFNKWARRPSSVRLPAVPPTYAYVFENVRDGKPFDDIGSTLPHNVHVHWFVHIPPARRHEFDGMLHGWLDRVTNQLTPVNAIHVQEIVSRKGIRRYSLKGANEKAAQRYGAAAKPQGSIVGRRTGTSTNLGRAARIGLDRVRGIRRRIA